MYMGGRTEHVLNKYSSAAHTWTPEGQETWGQQHQSDSCSVKLDRNGHSEMQMANSSHNSDKCGGGSGQEDLDLNTLCLY